MYIYRSWDEWDGWLALGLLLLSSFCSGFFGPLFAFIHSSSYLGFLIPIRVSRGYHVASSGFFYLGRNWRFGLGGEDI